MDERAEKMRAYEDEVKRQGGMHGPIGAVANLPPGTLGSPLTPPAMSTANRLAELCQHVAEAGLKMAQARAQFDAARGQREIAEGVFAKVVEELNYAIQEHREGTPENVPYPR